MSFRTLLFSILFLLSLYGLFLFLYGRNRDVFEAPLIRVDTAAVTSVVVSLQGQAAQELSFQREEEGWLVTDGVRSFKMPQSAIQSLLSRLTVIRTQSIASTDPAHWKDFNVDDEAGTRIRIYEGQTVIEDFIIGRFSTDTQKQSGVSYIRLTGQNEVYVIDGFQALSLCRNLDAYRNRALLNIAHPSHIDSIEFQLPDTTFRLVKRGDRQWWLNGNTTVDSLAVERFIGGLCRLSGDQFADDFDDLMAAPVERQALILHGDRIPVPLVVEIFHDSSRSLPFVIRSSQFPENSFASDSNGLFRRLRLPF